MIYEANCTRCGKLYEFTGLGPGQTRHREITLNKVCGGYPRRIYEVHYEHRTFEAALKRRLLQPKSTYILLKFRPLDYNYRDLDVLNYLREHGDKWKLGPGKVYPLADSSTPTNEDREKFPNLAKLLNW